VAMPSLVPSYSSNLTPRRFKSATSRSISSTSQNAWLALEAPAFGVEYRKHEVPPSNSYMTPASVSCLGLNPSVYS
jgi:hypothetical protein